MEDRIYIVGAHSRAQTFVEYLRLLYPETGVEAFLYDNEESNPEKIGMTPVLQMDGELKLNFDCPVYIATRGIYHEKLAGRLKEMGFREIRPVTPALDIRLRNAYVKKYYACRRQAFLKLEELGTGGSAGAEKTVRSDLEIAGKLESVVYVVRSIFDKPLRHPYLLASYEREIQAGAALTGERLYPGVFTDDMGDNISDRNKQFCELTALYWIWKQAREGIVGLAHYRRHFILPEDWELRMQNNQVDVVLPVPLYVAPSLANNFKSRHSILEWDCMMDCLKKRNVLECQEAENFFRGNLYSPCNMFIMRREALNDLCEWLFPVLFCVADHIGWKEDGYQNRYPGFLSERLISFFFEKNREKYKVAYADKNFLA